ncbi:MULTISPECIES: hypothetical protein [Acidianus]|uniref:Uncharacterized protein n=1 Tax=Candidatus Acidianus copahuensis TaxID=1160895 RepID=A0A031LK33_9CREN|nr:MULTISPECIES: hypothetical protein [Acidianus]EZQ01815.1 hypothetical protein CM19_12135 [Candidatus Acidianus copahuensis]NON63011.1 hypothetical protein [Acidianus sp. RZ1]
MNILQVYSYPSEAVVSCSLVDDKGNERKILTISLEDNGIHVHKLEKDDHYLIPPVPQIDMLIKEVIDQVAEELNVKAIIFRFGDGDKIEETEDLVLSEKWYDIESLAKAASKHAAIVSDVESKYIISVVKFSNFIYASTVIRKEDTFPLMQIVMDTSSDAPHIKIYNEVGQLVEDRKERVADFEDYVRSLVNSDDVAIVYKESLDEIPSPTEITTENGDKYFVGVIFKYFLGFFSTDDANAKRGIILRNRRRFSKVLRAILYLDRLSEEGGVEVLMPAKAILLEDVPGEVKKMKVKAENILKRFRVSEVNYFGVSDTAMKEIGSYNSSIMSIRVIPVGFIIVTKTKQLFDEYVQRISNGPTSDGYEILDEFIKKNASRYFIGYLMSLEEALIIYSDILNELNKDD